MTLRMTRLFAVTVTLISLMHNGSALAQYLPPIILQTPTQTPQLTPMPMLPQFIIPLQSPSLKDLPPSAPIPYTAAPASAAAAPAAVQAKAAASPLTLPRSAAKLPTMPAVQARSRAGISTSISRPPYACAPATLAHTSRRTRPAMCTHRWLRALSTWRFFDFLKPFDQKVLRPNYRGRPSNKILDSSRCR